jgi:hypothetical protein
MSIRKLFGWLGHRRASRSVSGKVRRSINRRCRLGVEMLETRIVPSSTSGTYNTTCPTSPTTTSTTVYTPPISVTTISP